MIRNITTKASVEQTYMLGAYLDSKGLSPVEVIAWLKSKKYTVNNINYQADRVASYVAGRQELKMELAKCTTIKQVKEKL